MLGRSALCVKVPSDPVTFFKNDAYFLDFCAQNYLLIIFSLNPYLTPKSPAFWDSKE